ncbi:MAG: hypothetical protein P8Z71_13870 [Candidatus Sulfobium sp.]
MGYKTYETDRYGRLTVYPSLHSPGRKLFCRKIFRRIMKAIVWRP